MKNRIADESGSDDSVNSLELLELFIHAPVIDMMFPVFTSMVKDSGWRKLPPEKAPIEEMIFKSFMLQAWAAAYLMRNPTDVLRDEDGDVGKVVAKLFQAVLDFVIDDFIEKMPSIYADLAEVYPSVAAFKQPWIGALKSAERTVDAANRITDLTELAYQAKTPLDQLTTRLDCFRIWKEVRPSTAKRYHEFYYIGSADSLTEAREIVLNEATHDLGTRQIKSSKAYFCGGLSPNGLRLLRAGIAGKNTGTLATDRITFETKPFTVFAQAVTEAEERTTTMVQSAHITHALLRLAVSDVFAQIDCVTQTMLAAMLIIPQSERVPGKTATQMTEAAIKQAKAGVALDSHVLQLSAFTWSQAAGRLSTQLDLLCATKTIDGFAFSEHAGLPSETGFTFTNADAINQVVWEWANGANRREPICLQKLRDHGVFTGTEIETSIGFPMKDKPEIF
jgi:hypothetical protein